jgi:hypothetical protein
MMEPFTLRKDVLNGVLRKGSQASVIGLNRTAFKKLLEMHSSDLMMSAWEVTPCPINN